MQLKYPQLGLNVICEEIKTLKTANSKAAESYSNLYSEVEKLKEDLISKENQINELKDQNKLLNDKIENEEYILNENKENEEKLSNLIIAPILEKLSKSQINSLLKNPFWLPDEEPEKFHVIGSTGHFGETASDKNRVIQIYINTDYSENILKVKVKYEHLKFLPGGDGVPSYYYPIIGDHYFVIMANGVVEKRENKIIHSANSIYLPIDLKKSMKKAPQTINVQKLNLLKNKAWSAIVTDNLKTNYKYNNSTFDYVIFDEEHKDMIVAIGFDLSDDFVPNETYSKGVPADILSNKEVKIDYIKYKYPENSEKYIFDNPLRFAVMNDEIFFFEWGKDQITDFWDSTTDITQFLDLIAKNRVEYLKEK